MNASVSNAANHLRAMEAADYGSQAMTYSKQSVTTRRKKKTENKKKKNNEIEKVYRV